MTTIFHDADADLIELHEQRIAVVGYGNQGRSWALNLRDSGLDVVVCVRNDETRQQAEVDGFAAQDLEAANDADVLCLLVPDDAIPLLPLAPKSDALVVVASGYTLAFGRLDPACDVGLVAPRMLGPEVRRCYEEGVGFITGVGVHHDATGRAQARVLALAKAIGGLKQGGIELTAMQEAVLDMGVEQALAPALNRVSTSFVQVMLEHGIPLEAIVTELVLSGEVERSYRLVRLEGYAAQMAHHSPVSQYGQLSRKPHFEHLDVAGPMREIVDGIESGRFADEWDAERDADFTHFKALLDEHAGAAVKEFEQDLRRKLGELAEA
ncbi:MAG TPA: NAD(P)-binding domain-containing protein [Acidimicrobiales bacterium]|nr:NAD(P)-binding domain-containing protein [Acidimicrobiales bacterium]